MFLFNTLVGNNNNNNLNTVDAGDGTNNIDGDGNNDDVDHNNDDNGNDDSERLNAWSVIWIKQIVNCGEATQLKRKKNQFRSKVGQTEQNRMQSGKKNNEPIGFRNFRIVAKPAKSG